ncbi:MAG: histidinol-phosphate transaminase [Gammaproteobacteria bacterium]|nr:histidinol-phosphate transaminase [Gammaproteobacteria bacterium]
MLREKVARWIRPEVRAATAYHVLESRGLIKLDAMENPYTWPARLKDEWLQRLSEVSLNRYPEPAARDLKARLRDVMNVPSDMDILLGNGSDELIQIVTVTLSGPGRSVLAPEPTFVMYRAIAEVHGINFVGVPLRPDNFSLDLSAMLSAIKKYQPAAVFLAWPNNPTGNLFDVSAVEQIIRSASGLVVMDEAYHTFAGESFMDRLQAYDNLLVMRTVSKLGLAGLRLGMLAGQSGWINEFDKVRLPYNIGVLTQVSADFILAHHGVLDEQARQICDDRQTLFRELSALPGIKVWPSRANFILFRTASDRVNDVFEGLRAHGILIKNLDGTHELLQACLRVTVGGPEENDRFLNALGSLL